MSTPTQSSKIGLKDYVTLYAYKLICLIMRCMSVRAVAVFGRIVGYLVWALMPGRRRIVARNLRIVVDPTLRENKLRPMVRRNMVRTTMNLACSLKTGLMSRREMEKAIRIEGGDVFAAHGIDGHTVISCIPHAGNWEILARIRPLFSQVEHFGSMYRRLSNPLLEEFVYKTRTRHGCEMYSKEEGLREVIKLARSGGLLGVLSDQYTSEGIYVPYFGKVTGVTPLPALLYKRCKGKGHLFSVFTRNTALGRWDAVLGRQIHLPEGCDSLPSITMQVNLALEQCQKENILDGFWMHHRWKTNHVIAPEMDDDTRAAIAAYARLPFRIIVCTPEEEEQARVLTNVVRTLTSFRPDAQVTVLCPEAQAEYWRTTVPSVAHVLTTDGKQSIAAQFNADEVYKDGPFDLLFMYSTNKRVFKRLSFLKPPYVTGWADNPLAPLFRARHKRRPGASGPYTEEDYAESLKRHYKLNVISD